MGRMDFGSETFITCQASMQTWPAEVASCLNAHFGDKQGIENQHIDQGAPLYVPVEGFDASEDGTGRGTPLVPVAFGLTTEQTPKFYENAALTLTKQSPTGGGQPQACVTPAMQVRRLTPRECERLQGFPDDYTAIPFRGKPAADGNRYKALGNSFAVNVVSWIGQRIQQVTNEKLE